MTLCRADKVLLGGGAAIVGGFAMFGTPLGVAIPAAGFAAVMLDGVFRPSSTTFYPTISHGPRERANVALTFDDGPDEEVTPAVLDILGAAGAHSTFFSIGRNLERNLPLGRRIVAEQHELANHSWRHAYWQNFYTTRQHAADLARNTAIIQDITGSKTEPWYRPPVGLKSPGLARAAQARKLDIVAWSVHSRDTILRDPTRIAAHVLHRVRPGDIVLMHDGHDLPGRHRRGIVAALPLILAGLAERALKPVTVSRLLQP
jgi:peptidoglycan/xylan/chitin deacetylase (PgdA/CDA1 family)